MRNLIDDHEDRLVVSKMLKGAVMAHPNLKKLDHINSVVSSPNDRQVVLISGGGSGHEPLDLGYVGAGALDAAIVGDIFIPPSAEQIVQTVQYFGNKRPILFIVKNFAADRNNFLKASEVLREQGYVVEILIVDDDRSVDPETKEPRRRGVAGTIFIHKLLGAAADKDYSMAQLLELGKKAIANLSTLGVALSGAEIPNRQLESFQLNSDEIAYGIGIHGEKGYRTEKYQSFERLSRELVNKLYAVSGSESGTSIAILVNGLGTLPLMDQFVFTRSVVNLFELKGLHPELVKTGNYLTSYNMTGISITLFKIEDPNWIKLLNYDTTAFAWQ